MQNARKRKTATDFSAADTPANKPEEAEAAPASSGASAKESKEAASRNKKRGKKRKETSSADVKYRLSGRIDEDMKTQLYAVQFNMIDPRHQDEFATCGGRRATVYKNHADGFMEPLQTWVDEDPNEVLYTCAWSCNDKTGAPLLLIAGTIGTIKVINVAERQMVMVLVGHGGSVNELRIHPKDPNLVLSVSKDESARLWNLKTGKCIAIFAGEGGHRDDVLSADFHLTGDRFVSCGLDHSIKVWDLKSLEASIADSYSQAVGPKPFKTQLHQFPEFSSEKIHNNYVDCVRWYGDFILSKSVGHKILMWTIHTEDDRKTWIKLQEFRFSDCGIWYVRFGLDRQQKLLGCGNKTGTLFVWDLESPNPNPPQRLAHFKSTSTVRMTSFNADGSTIIGVCDNCTVFRWDRIEDAKKASPTPVPTPAAAASSRV